MKGGTVSLAQVEHCYVVDDDPEFCASIVALLQSVGYESSGFANAEAFLKVAALIPAGVLLLDLRIPHVSGLDLLEHHSSQVARFAVVVISGHGDIGRAVRSIKAGALDFIEKPFASNDLLELVAAAQKVLGQRTSDNADRHQAETKLAILSPREHEVLRMIVAGAPNKIVARTLDLSVRTVEMHRANMLAKLGARSTADAIHMAMLCGVMPWPLPGVRHA